MVASGNKTENIPETTRDFLRKPSRIKVAIIELITVINIETMDGIINKIDPES